MCGVLFCFCGNGCVCACVLFVFAGVFVGLLWFGVDCVFCVVWLVWVRGGVGVWLYDFDFCDVVYSVVFEESEGFFEGVCLGECWDL